MNEFFISPIVAISLAVTMMFLNTGISLSAASSDEQKALIDKVVSVKNESELKNLIGDNIKQPSEKWNLRYYNVFIKALKKNPSEKSTKAIVNFLSNTVIASKDSISKSHLNTVLGKIITSPRYSPELKGIAMKAFKTSPRDWSRLANYFLTPENQKTPLFKQYFKWCLSASDESSFDFVRMVFDNLDEQNQARVIQQVEIKTGDKETRQVKFLRGVLLSEKYDASIKNLAKKRIGSLKKGTDHLVVLLSKVKNENDVEKLLADKLKSWNDLQNFDYNVFKQAIDITKSVTSQKAILLYLQKNFSGRRKKIGIILLAIVSSDKYSLELKKMAMTPDAFRYIPTFKEGLLKYFSIAKNKKSALYNAFFKLLITNSSNDDCLDFIQKNFDTFSDKGKIKTVASLEYVNYKVPSEFLKNILKNDKYSRDLKVAAKKRLTVLEPERQAEIERNRPRSMKELVGAYLTGIERKIQKLERHVNKGDTLTEEEVQFFTEIFEQSNKMFEMLKLKCDPEDETINDKTMNDARKKLKELRGRVDKILKDKNKI